MCMIKIEIIHGNWYEVCYVVILSQLYVSMTSENEVVGDKVVEISTTKKDIWPQNIESHFITLMVEEVIKDNMHTTT